MASFRKHKSGWEYRISYKDANGKFKEKSKRGFKNKTEAHIAAYKVELELSKDNFVNKDISLYDYFDVWVNTYKIGKVTNNTLNTYIFAQQMIEKYFGDKKLSDISSIFYQNILNDMSTDYGYKTIKYFHSKLKKAVSMAEYDGYIDKNFCEYAIVSSIK